MNQSITYLKRYGKQLTLCCFLFASACCLRAQEAEPRLNFHISSARLDSSYMDNRLNLRQLGRLLADSALAVHIDSLDISSYASPDGNPTRNGRLARRRSETSREYLLLKYPYLDPRRIRTDSRVGSWEALLSAVEADPQVPARGRVMAILTSDASPATKQANLRLLAGGTAYRYLSRHHLPEWRNATIGTTWMPGYSRLAQLKAADIMETKVAEALVPDITETQKPLARLSSDDLSSLSSADFKSAETKYKDFQYATLSHSAYDRYLADLHRLSPRRVPLLALKTNLLFDLALMPNFEVELPIGKHNRYSLNGEIMFPWWLMKDNKYCLQILMGGLEARYWLGSRRNRANREVLTGHFLGLYAGGGKYDLQWNRDGYQGEFFIAAGISYGYAHKIARNLRLEYNIGIGLLRTNYEYYHTLDNYQTLLWQNNGRYTWLGPTKLKVSLVWLLNRKVKLKKGGER